MMKGENLQGLVEFVAQSLVDQPTEVTVESHPRGNTVYIDLHVAKDDMGRVIGKGGRVANSLRTLLKVAAARDGNRTKLDIIEPN
jgi:predicted RNA-binding protein YlqC (UPF0109 family)